MATDLLRQRAPVVLKREHTNLWSQPAKAGHGGELERQCLRHHVPHPQQNAGQAGLHPDGRPHSAAGHSTRPREDVKGFSVSGLIPQGSIPVVADADPGDIRIRLCKDDDHTVMFH